MLTIGGSGVEEKSPGDLGSTRSDGGTNMASSEWMSLDGLEVLRKRLPLESSLDLAVLA